MWNSYWIDFSKWEVFVNDDHTRTFVSVEVITAGLAEVCWRAFSLNNNSYCVEFDIDVKVLNC